MVSQLQKAKSGWDYYQQLVDILKLQRVIGVGLGELLFKLKANNLYQKSIGAGVDSWPDFLKMPEIGLEVREANRAMELYETFCLRYGYPLKELATAKTKSLHYLLPLAKSDALPEERIRELVEDAKHLSQNQFRENLFDAKTGDKGERSYQFVLMRKCDQTGTLQKVHGVSSEQIQEAFLKANIELPNLFDLPEIL